MKTINSLIPQEYDFSGLDIHQALTFQDRINERIEALRESQEKKLTPIIEELEILSLALDNHISQEIKRQETEKFAKTLHDGVSRMLAHDEIERKKEEGPPFTS